MKDRVRDLGTACLCHPRGGHSEGELAWRPALPHPSWKRRRKHQDQPHLGDRRREKQMLGTSMFLLLGRSVMLSSGPQTIVLRC